jgi:flagellar basal body-associated protein FliL
MNVKNFKQYSEYYAQPKKSLTWLWITIGVTAAIIVVVVVVILMIGKKASSSSTAGTSTSGSQSSGGTVPVGGWLLYEI